MGKRTLVHLYNERLFSDKKGMSYQVTKRHEGYLSVYCKKSTVWQKPAQYCKANSLQLKKKKKLLMLHSVQFQLDDIVKKIKQWRQ